jgi:glycosyltransferase involved in cell wall biosynthesis
MSRPDPPAPQRRLHVVFLNWRDTANPEGGGSERYVESVAGALVEAGHRVTVLCAAHANAPADEVRGGVVFRRRGSKLGVYPRAGLALALRRTGPFDIVVDVQNGVPFLSRLVTRRPVVVLVHHVHREQWPVVYGRTVARVGWWVESVLAPRVYRHCQYVAVSQVTRSELVGIGVDPQRIAVVHNGNDARPPGELDARSPHPSMVVLGRLVPHKRVEHALAALAALRPELADLSLTVLGEGWWAGQLAAEARRLGVQDAVRFTGFVDEAEKNRQLGSAWVLAMPSLKEGWGLAVTEAASHAVPAVAYRSAGGVAESVVHGETGLLVEDGPEAFVAGVRALLVERGLRERLGTAARARAGRYSWTQTAESFAVVLHGAVLKAPPTCAVDPVGTGPEDGLGVELVQVEPVSLDGR